MTLLEQSTHEAKTIGDSFYRDMSLEVIIRLYGQLGAPEAEMNRSLFSSSANISALRYFISNLLKNEDHTQALSYFIELFEMSKGYSMRIHYGTFHSLFISRYQTKIL